MKKFFLITFLFCFIIGGVLFYRFKSRDFLNLSIEEISISSANESDFLNSSVENKENPEDYFDIVFDIKAKNTSQNLCAESVKPHIILPKEFNKEDLIDVGVTSLSNNKGIYPKKEEAFPYKIFLKKNNYSKEEILKILKESTLKVNILSYKKGHLKYLTYGGSCEYIN